MVREVTRRGGEGGPTLEQPQGPWGGVWALGQPESSVRRVEGLALSTSRHGRLTPVLSKRCFTYLFGCPKSSLLHVGSSSLTRN